MTLPAGTRLGPYEILAPIGAGGMGEVYRARDTRLEREVAIKVLPAELASNVERLRRFEKEARSASALNHPSIVTIYDVGQTDGVSWIAMELVEGKTLRELLASGALPVKRLLQLATAVAEGLARAHGAGIVHRDLKPENVMVSRDGLVKILDFGLAKLSSTGSGSGEGSQLPTMTGTTPGVVVGTVGYMSPEQAGGEALDFRSDQFSFGSVLYEMATGKRAFQKKTAIDTLGAILNTEPEPIAQLNPQVPAPLRWIVERCLSKEPRGRYSATDDLAHDLATLRDHLTEAVGIGAAPVAPSRSRAIRRRVLFGAGIAAALALVYFIGVQRGIGKVPMPTFHQLTFQRGSVGSARFTSDGRSVVYSASWGGAPERLFTTRIEKPASAALVLPDASLAAVSSSDELLLLAPRTFGAFRSSLSRAPLAGGAPRAVAEGVLDADWGPDGSALALLRRVGEHTRLEYPIGRVLVERENAATFSPRVSRDGRWVAFYLAPSLAEGADGNASVAIVDRSGHAKILSSEWGFPGTSLHWSPKGDEIWFNATKGRETTAPLSAVSLSGRERTVLRLPGFNNLEDVSADGRVLLTHGRGSTETRCRLPGWERERDLSWFMTTLATSISADGKSFLFFSARGDADAEVGAYLRGTDGSPALRLGEGIPLYLSPDGGKVLAWDPKQRQYVVLSTGPGEPRRPLKPEADSDFHYVNEGPWFPDSRRVLLVMRKKGSDLRTYSLDVETGKLEPLTPASYNCIILSLDGKKAFCDTSQGRRIYSFDSHETREVSGLEAEDAVLEWSSDGNAFFIVNRKTARRQIFRLDLASGHRQLWREFDPLVPAGIEKAFITPDGGSYCYIAIDKSNDLYLVEGLK